MARLTSAAVEDLATSGQRAPIARLTAGVGAVAYLLLFSVYLLVSGGWPTPDYLIPPLLLFAVALGRGWSFLFDWAPFLVLILAWQASAGLAYQLGRPVHLVELVGAERWLFRGHVPTVALQGRLYHPGDPRWYDWLGAAQHAAHFALPVAAGVVLWLRGRRLYWRYIASLMLVFGLGYAGYVLYPAAPPWMAGDQGIIPPVHRVAVETMARFAATRPVGLAYLHMNANPVAAMPSLHAALPMLVALVALRLWAWRALPALLYALAMGYNAVYLGEHYVVDVLAGYAVAATAFALVWLLPAALPSPRVGWRPPAMRVPLRVRRLGDATLLAAAAASLLIIASSLRPSPPARDADLALGPGISRPRPPAPTALDATPCGEGGSPAPAVQWAMFGVAQDYAVYLIDLDDSACYALVDRPELPPPTAEERGSLAAAAPVTPALAGATLGAELVVARIGQPAPALAAAGVPEDRDYLLVIRFAEVADPDAAALAVEHVAGLAFREGG